MSHVHGEGKRVRVFIGESDRFHNRPLDQAIVLGAREMGVAGATVLRGVEGYGADSVLHTARLLRLSEDLPIVIEVVEMPDQIGPFVERAEIIRDQPDRRPK